MEQNTKPPLTAEIQSLLRQYSDLAEVPQPWLEQLSHEISSRLAKTNDSSGKEAKPTDTTLKEQVDKALCFMPCVVTLVYTQHKPAALERFAHTATERHFTFLQRAVSNVVRRFAGMAQQYGGDANSLEEDLWGQTMEDLMRQLTDRQARLWDASSRSVSVFPPEIQRRGNHGAAVRVALSQRGDYLAMFHTDQRLTIWQTATQEETRVFDLSFLHYETTELTDETTPVALHFSAKRPFVGVEYRNGQIAVLDYKNEDSDIQLFDARNMAAFLQTFGPVVPSHRQKEIKNRFSQIIDDTLNETADTCLDNVFDWVCDRSGQSLFTASTKARRMPPWMMDIGFERAVYVIVKRRLIDWIRKNNHASYVCWHCGTASASAMDEQCRHCGADFSACLINLPKPPCDPPKRENNWTCTHCGLSSRVREPAAEPREDDLYGQRFKAERDWQEQHDFEKIKEKLKDIVLTYRKRSIPCNDLLELKARGLTNEEIGEELEVPRGSVDYLWNQCRGHIQTYFGEPQDG